MIWERVIKLPFTLVGKQKGYKEAIQQDPLLAVIHGVEDSEMRDVSAEKAEDKREDDADCGITTNPDGKVYIKRNLKFKNRI